MAITFDGATKRIVLGAGTVLLSVRVLWSRWCDWMAEGDNSKYLEAMKQVGGDVPEIPIFIFLLNGWRIVPQSADHTLEIYDGVLYVDGGGDPFVDPAGTYKIRMIYKEPGIAIGFSTGGGGATPAEIAAAILAAAASNPIFADMRRTNGQQIIGDGTAGDKFRSHLVG